MELVIDSKNIKISNGGRNGGIDLQISTLNNTTILVRMSRADAEVLAKAITEKNKSV